MIRRFKTREVWVGNVGIGGSNPVRIQSMTNTNTMDTAATVAQSIRLYEAGCELVRITAQGKREAEHLAVIKSELRHRGYDFPLIADIHFSPASAEIAAGIVEKVRINPGNYTDRNRGKINFTPEEYTESLDEIRQNLTPLLEICKAKGTAIRIGSNHGSLSDRIVDRYGDTPEGMAEAAMEFARICRGMDFHNIVFSMKASNTRVMVYATRLLTKKMMDEGMDYPVHLGVTEAGDGREGRIKSAVGIGTLLSDGIGDTLRVSLTEDPVNEIPVARKIVDYIHSEKPGLSQDIFAPFFHDPFGFGLRQTKGIPGYPKPNKPLVIGPEHDYTSQKPDITAGDEKLGTWQRFSAEYTLETLKNGPVLLHSSSSPATLHFRNFFRQLENNNLNNPVVMSKYYPSAGDELAIEAAIDFGPAFLDGFGDGLFLQSEQAANQEMVSVAFDILQASGARISKTEFIACPSCGRTQYDIQASLKKIRAATSHLKGLKIAVMGCIVNGPGEMADADYGYVGMGTGKVAIYKGKKQVMKNVDENQAVDTLIRIIKDSGDWQQV